MDAPEQLMKRKSGKMKALASEWKLKNLREILQRMEGWQLSYF